MVLDDLGFPVITMAFTLYRDENTSTPRPLLSSATTEYHTLAATLGWPHRAASVTSRLSVVASVVSSVAWKGTDGMTVALEGRSLLGTSADAAGIPHAST